MDEQESALLQALRLKVEQLEKACADKDREIALLSLRREQQAEMLDKLAYINEELEAQVRELQASRWRRIGRRLRLAKPASFEK
ncbi:MAG TPA: hypothetical protein VFA23_00435 [Dongiaceae bacterium]|nr:hypothetical protein [Dongiaceae bacterium]